MTKPNWLPGTVFVNINGFTDELFDEVLIRTAITIANKQYKTKFFNKDNVYEYLGFADDCKNNLHKDNLILVKPIPNN